MSDKKSAFQSIEDKIKHAAKEAEDFADKVTADEQPVEVVSEDAVDTSAGKKPPQ